MKHMNTFDTNSNTLPLISVIVPIYNVEGYVRPCIESLIAQVYSNIEIILVDDGSTDGSGNICDEYEKKDSRVKVIHQENAGISAARNVALDIARGEYITFVDGDDWVESSYVSVLYDVINITGAEISTSLSIINDKKPEAPNIKNIKVFSSREAIINMSYFKYDLCSVGGEMFSRNAIKDIKFSEDIPTAEDIYFNIEAFLNTDKISFINYQGYHYIIRPDSLSHNRIDVDSKIQKSFDMILDLIYHKDTEIGDLITERIPEINKQIACFLSNKSRHSL